MGFSIGYDFDNSSLSSRENFFIHSWTSVSNDFMVFFFYSMTLFLWFGNCQWLIIQLTVRFKLIQVHAWSYCFHMEFMHGRNIKSVDIE